MKEEGFGQGQPAWGDRRAGGRGGGVGRWWWWWWWWSYHSMRRAGEWEDESRREASRKIDIEFEMKRPGWTTFDWLDRANKKISAGSSFCNFWRCCSDVRWVEEDTTVERDDGDDDAIEKWFKSQVEVIVIRHWTCLFFIPSYLFCLWLYNYKGLLAWPYVYACVLIYRPCLE